MYKILFIDEEKDTLNDFKDYVDETATKVKLEIVADYPLSDLEDMIDSIFKMNIDAIIVDYKLNEKKTDIDYTVKYNGVELIEEFLKIRAKFPCFVLTSYDVEAVNSSEDVNKVYIKNIIHNIDEESKARAKFLDRVIIQIEHYQTEIKKAEKELQKLIELRKIGKALISDEEKIIELDDFLENAIDKRDSIPKELKRITNEEKLDNLLSKVDSILKKIDNGK